MGNSVISNVDAERLERLRKRYKSYKLLFGIVIVVFCLAVSYFMMNSGKSEAMRNMAAFVGVACFVVFAVMSFRFIGLKDDYIDEYKRVIVSRVLKECLGDNNYTYDPKKYFTRTEIKNIRFLSIGAYTHIGEDMITGSYNQVAFRQSDMRCYYTSGSDEHEKTTYVMKGRLAEFDFNADIMSDIAVVQKGYKFANIEGMEKIEMENADFNKRFDVYSGDAHSVFYLLTPQFMEYITSLSKMGKLYIRFIRGKVYVLRHEVAGVFEPNIENPVDVDKEYNMAKRDMEEMLRIITVLKLDESVRKKQIVEEEQDKAWQEEYNNIQQEKLRAERIEPADMEKAPPTESKSGFKLKQD